MAVNGIQRIERIWVKRITEKGETIDWMVHSVSICQTKNFWKVWKS